MNIPPLPEGANGAGGGLGFLSIGSSSSEGGSLSTGSESLGAGDTSGDGLTVLSLELGAGFGLIVVSEVPELESIVEEGLGGTSWAKIGANGVKIIKKANEIAVNFTKDTP